MNDYVTQVDIIIADFDALENEIRRGLSGEGPADIRQVMETGGYLNQLGVIQQQIQTLMDRIQKHLAQLKITVGKTPDMTRPPEETKSEIQELNNLKSQLLAVWSRLETLIALVEQKELAQRGAISKVVAQAKSWAATLGAWIRRISSQLWQLLCRLMTPKEWKLSGKIGTGPFGLVDVGVEITFG